MEPIAIIGLGCRFPGAPDPDSFWRLLRDGVDAITEVPPDRWDIEELYDPDPAAPGKMVTRWGGFLEAVDQFDPHFFGIAPREAAAMDPQQRLLLEVTWEALEHASLPPSRLAGSQTGVFIGICGFDYSWCQAGDLDQINAYSGTGFVHSIAPNRLSYLLDLRGPSYAVDTACSSSLLAVHLACHSIWAGEAPMALAGGVNALLAPEATVGFSKARMMAPDGRCKTFDAAADGYVRGEGCGMVVLKPLSAALRDGDNILALVRGSAINQDGRSNGMTAPNGPAQQAVVRQALQLAGVAPAQISFIEAHGTGTALGDPIEVQALAAVLGEGRAPDQACVVGSVKPNIGHLEGAAGIAGLIKAVLCLQHREIPPQIFFNRLNPLIQISNLPLVIPTERQPWPAWAKPRFAGINSFGFGGTNAHVVLEEAPALPTAPAAAERPRHLLALSARSDNALRELAGRFARYLAGESAASLADVCFSANSGRTHHPHRLAAAAETGEQLRETLETFAAGRAAPGLLLDQVDGRTGPKVAFLFTGQGAQSPGMARQLYATQPTFRATLDRCAALLAPCLERPLQDVLYPADESASPIHETAYTQPALFALEYALAELWQSWGLKPALLLGHSIGEYVAACVAGVFPLEQGLRLVAERARLMQALPREGKMAAVLAGEAQVAGALAAYRGQVSIAAINGPRNTVISGAAGAVEAILAELNAAGISAHPLTVSHAFHSPLMEPMLAAFERAAGQVRFAAPRIPLVSNLTGQLLESSVVPDAAYWRRHVREPVRFAAGVATLAEQGCTAALELGPHPVLIGMARQCRPAGLTDWLPSLQQGRADWDVLLESLGSLYIRGLQVDWAAFDADYPRRRVPLPTYPFERERFWFGSGAAPGVRPTAYSENGRGSARHPLLGQRLRAAHGLFESRLSTKSHPYLNDHRIQGSVLLPGMAFVELGLAAAADAFGTEACELADVRFRQALVLRDGETHTLQLILSPNSSDETAFHVYSRAAGAGSADDPWALHTVGELRADRGDGDGAVELPALLAEVRARCPEKARSAHYQDLADRGFSYGPRFQSIDQLWRRDGEALGRLRLPEVLESEGDRYRLHPVLLDGGGQVLTATIPLEDTYGTIRDTLIPVSIERVRFLRRPGSELWAHARLSHYGGRSGNFAEGDIDLFDGDGRLVVQISGLRAQRLLRDAERDVAEDVDDWLYDVRWQPVPSPETPPEAPATARGSWLVFADRGGVGQALAALLAQRGEAGVLVTPGSGYEWLDAERVCLDPARPDDFRRLLRSAAEGGRPGWRGFVHLWSLDLPEPDAAGAAALEEAELLGCGSALHLVQASAELGGAAAPRLWLVTRGAQAVRGPSEPVSAAQAPLWGLGRVIAQEHPNLRCTSVDLGTGDDVEIDALFRELWTGDDEDQLAFRGEARYAARLVRRGPAPGTTPSATEDDPSAADDDRRLVAPRNRPFRLEAATAGRLDSLTLRTAGRGAPGPGQVEIQVRAAGLNFRDVLKAMGLYPAGPDDLLRLGDECAGRIAALGEGVEGLRVGDEVVAVAPACFGSFATTPAEFVVPKPPGLSFEEAVTVPITFLTAYYALCHLGRLQRGERVLIHAAAGGVGLAAVQIAKWLGAEIFATAGSPDKRELLRSLGVEQVMDSRSLAFSGQVMERTGGRGVDVVLNSLAGEAIPRSLACLAPYGRFLEIGKRDIYQNSKLGLWPFQNNLAFFAIDMDRLMRERPRFAGSLFREIVSRLEDGTFRPLPHTDFPIEQAVGAFRHMALARHVGKIVLTLPECEVAGGPADEPTAMLRADGTYLITGGLGSLGLAVARWMVDQGARHLALMGRRGPTDAARTALDEMQAAGARVAIVNADVAQERQLADALDELTRTMPPLRGVVHAAGILDDGILLQQDLARFRAVMAPKVRGAWNLHALTADLPLDFLVFFSSVAAVLGSPGQGNYAAANAFLDGLAQQRRAQGRPGLSINWGPWGQVGMAARTEQDGRRAQFGINSIRPERGLEALERLLWQDDARVVVLAADWQRWREAAPRAAELSLLRDLLPGEAAASQREPGRLSREAVFATDPAERQGLLEAYVRDEVARILQLDPARLDPGRPLNMMGLDSLMGIELKNLVEADLAVVVPMASLVEGPSISQLAAQLLELVVEAADRDGTLQPGASAAADGDGGVDGRAALQFLKQLDQLSDDEVDTLLGDLLSEEQQTQQARPEVPP